MVGGRCHDPCRDSPTGWTCGSSSSSTWCFSCLSTCCPEGAARPRRRRLRQHKCLSGNWKVIPEQPQLYSLARAVATKGILTYFAPYEHRRWTRRTICAG